ncbi:MAG: hypothetical protein IT285_12425, partial [Bdellovibrionales bacterium]|nr:hypothetical protein [Bdellovibrionales bacterium]
VGDITQGGTATGITWSLSTGDNISWTLTATAVTGAGTLVPSLANAIVADLAGLANDPSTSTDNSVTYLGAEVLEFFGDELAFDFGSQILSYPSRRRLAVINRSASAANPLGAGAPALVAPFSFAGGAFPGTSGTCPNGGSLAAGAVCLVDVEFNPTAPLSASDTVRVAGPPGADATRGLSGVGSDRVEVLQVGVGTDHSCALLNNHTVKCWGGSNSGQLGQGDMSSRGDGPGERNIALRPVDLGSGARVARITVGYWHSCALLVDGGVKCWGYNTPGALGLGDSSPRGDASGEMGDNLPLVDLGTGRSAQDVVAGGNHTCALLDNGSVKCWGGNNFGQLGLGDFSYRGDNAGEMGNSLPIVSLGTGRTAQALAAGGAHTCALLDDGSVKCWGRGIEGQLGQGDGIDRGDGAGEMGDSLPPINLGTGRTAKAITAGDYFTCALLDDDSVKCWGENNYGQLGLGDFSYRGDNAGEMGDSLPALSLGAGRTPHALAAGTQHACALLDDNTVKCWGNGTGGQLGHGNSTNLGDNAGEMGDSLLAVDLGAGRTAFAVSGGYNQNCAILDDGSVKCWGWNGFGKLGLGDTSARGDAAGEMGDFLPALDLGTGRVSVSVAAGRIHSCALLANGSVKCWGGGIFGQLGLGNPQDMGEGLDGGGGPMNEMGDNLPAVDLGTGRTAKAIAVGDFHSCAILDDDSVKCWGHNGSGQLGQGDLANRGGQSGEMGDNLPAIDLGTGRTAKAIAAGFSHTCAILDDDSLKCWGDNTYGQLGLGDNTSRGFMPGQMGDSLPAVDLGTSHTALAITAGADHSCVILENDAVKCWGRNHLGQLGLEESVFSHRGDGANEMGDNLPAVMLGTGRSASALSAGSAHTCAILDDATLKCWGSNQAGELGLEDGFDRGDGLLEMGDNLPTVSLGSGRTAVAVFAARSKNTCALLDNGSVKCWGENDDGQLGQGDTNRRGDFGGQMGDALQAIDLGLGRTPLSLSAGAGHVCAVREDFVIKCWGGNGVGQLGVADTLPRGDDWGEMGNLLPEALH